MDMITKIKEGLGLRIVSWEERSPRRVYLTVNKEDIFEVSRFLFKELGLRFSTASGIDAPLAFEIIYHFSDDASGVVYSLRVVLSDKLHPQVDSLTPVFAAAEWVEREIWEMLGINFKNHPNLKRLLLAEDWPQGDYPLRQGR
ncbi:MAG: NADH-quinone oxidoreductase subunit C [Candidatus Omnitrophica bacterium]|nr:NADH-quinone oxidoreductase subunit C [Candidatus Omnitrophota bacterium]